jgi:hypothetical protein
MAIIHLKNLGTSFSAINFYVGYVDINASKLSIFHEELFPVIDGAMFIQVMKGGGNSHRPTRCSHTDKFTHCLELLIVSRLKRVQANDQLKSQFFFDQMIVQQSCKEN